VRLVGGRQRVRVKRSKNSKPPVWCQHGGTYARCASLFGDASRLRPCGHAARFSFLFFFFLIVLRSLVGKQNGQHTNNK